MVFETLIPNPYLRAVVMFALIFILLKIASIILKKVFSKAAFKTKTDLDDIILEKSVIPLNIIIILIAINLSEEILPLSDYISTTLSNIVSSLTVIVIGYLFFVLVDLFSLRALKRFSTRTKTKLDDNLASLIHAALKVVLTVIVFLYIFTIWGIQVIPILGALGVAGLAVALALQPTLSNIFSGISMIFDKTVSVGDLVYLDQNTKGKIHKIGLRSTKIVTFDNELIIIPNNKLAESMIQNVALPSEKSRAVVQFSVAYGSNIDKVKKLILKEINSITHITKDPEPIVRFVEMGVSSLNFKAYFYVDTYEHRFNAIDEANTKIYNSLNKAGIEIPFPQMDVYLKKK